MKRIGATLVLLMFPMIEGLPQKNLIIHSGFLKAQVYLDMSQNDQRVYAMGLLDGFDMAPMFDAPDNNKWLVSITTCVEGMKGSQVAAIIEKYIKGHPERWHWDLQDAA